MKLDGLNIYYEGDLVATVTDTVSGQRFINDLKAFVERDKDIEDFTDNSYSDLEEQIGNLESLKDELKEKLDELEGQSSDLSKSFVKLEAALFRS